MRAEPINWPAFRSMYTILVRIGASALLLKRWKSLAVVLGRLRSVVENTVLCDLKISRQKQLQELIRKSLVFTPR
jgi:hypothetical protein